MTDGYEDTEAATDEGELGWLSDGSPTLASLGVAIQVWTITNYSKLNAVKPRGHETHMRGFTVKEVAEAFNVPVERVTAAVERHYWMDLIGAGETAEIHHEGN